MKPAFYSGLKLGILGGGQLGRMLLQACADFSVETWVLDPDPNAPARPFAHRFVGGSFRDPAAVLDFGRQVDVLTLEIEDVATEALAQLEAEGRSVHPAATVVGTVQDKGQQKLFFQREGIPTADFVLVENRRDLARHTDRLPGILKLRRGGYDGRGVMRLDTPVDLETAFDAPSVLERRVDIAHEISVVAARNACGQMSVYPPVDMVFDPVRNLVQLLYAPARLPDPLLGEAERTALHIAERLGVVGLLAVEFFVDRAGWLWVNELAPRPHNSGHHTIEANLTSQFEQHLRAVLGLPLGSPALRLPAVMLNLVGSEGATGQPRYAGIEEALAMEGVKLHLYGKREVRPGRKMGHLTIIDPSLDGALAKARELARRLRVEGTGTVAPD